MIVHTSIGGSVCVVQLTPDWEHYIDARKDVRYPYCSVLEFVAHGQVRKRSLTTNEEAPRIICDWLRNFAGRRPA